MNKEEKRIARCLCLKALYAYSSSGNSFKDVIKNFYKNSNEFEYNINEDQIDYSSSLFDLTIKYELESDELIISKLVNWDIKRLALLDKLILRMSIAEMLYMKDVPPKVSIAEGVEIAKEFSTIDSSSFVNGILDAIYNDKENVKE